MTLFQEFDFVSSHPVVAFLIGSVIVDIFGAGVVCIPQSAELLGRIISGIGFGLLMGSFYCLVGAPVVGSLQAKASFLNRHVSASMRAVLTGILVVIGFGFSFVANRVQIMLSYRYQLFELSWACECKGDV